MELKGKIEGKIASATGPGDLKGDFKGTFTAVVQAVIKGTYRVPPPQCSEDGRVLSEEEDRELRLRKGRGFSISKSELKAGDPSEAESVRQRKPGRSLWEEERKLREEERKLRLEEARRQRKQLISGEPVRTAFAREAKVPPAEPNTRGKFSRWVSGTVNGIKPPTITLDLPPLPILDHRCNVIDELPKRTLKLVKQH
jgi:hypothetical protein